MYEAGRLLGAVDDPARQQLLDEAIAEVHARAGRYLREPAESAWLDLVDALTRAHGDSEAYELLRAIEIHTRISGRR
jgi:hypothetical protein